MNRTISLSSRDPTSLIKSVMIRSSLFEGPTTFSFPPDGRPLLINRLLMAPTKPVKKTNLSGPTPSKRVIAAETRNRPRLAAHPASRRCLGACRNAPMPSRKVDSGRVALFIARGTLVHACSVARGGTVVSVDLCVRSRDEVLFAVYYRTYRPSREYFANHFKGKNEEQNLGKKT